MNLSYTSGYVFIYLTCLLIHSWGSALASLPPPVPMALIVGIIQRLVSESFIKIYPMVQEIFWEETDARTWTKSLLFAFAFVGGR